MQELPFLQEAAGSGTAEGQCKVLSPPSKLAPGRLHQEEPAEKQCCKSASIGYWDVES